MKTVLFALCASLIASTAPAPIIIIMRNDMPRHLPVPHPTPAPTPAPKHP